MSINQMKPYRCLTGLFVLLLVMSPISAIAAPRFTLNPSNTSVTNGSEFDVMMGVNSETEKVIGIDVVANFDSAKLEIVSIQKASIPDGGYNFTYTANSPIIKNDLGKFEVTLPSANSSVYEGTVANHDLLKITFRAKSLGTASVSFVCTAGSVTESNIINQSGSDVIDCSANQTGTYTIVAGAGGATTAPSPTATPTQIVTTESNNNDDDSDDSTNTSTTTTTTTTSQELPRTGSFETTVGVMLAGLLSLIVAKLWLKV